MTNSTSNQEKISLRQMIGDFYNKQMAHIVLFVWVLGILFMAAAVLCAVKFFDAQNTKEQIMFAAGFLLFAMWINLIKIFAWQMIHRNHLTRKMNQLESKITELKQKLQLD